MKISYQWLKAYIDINQSPTEIAHLLTQGGLEVEGIETFEAIKGSLEGVVVGEITKCAKHPNADRLKKTTVDIGADKPLSIICGAPNVDKGQKVLVATVGTTLYPSNGESFKIKKSKIRGEVSEGMICAEDELGLGNNHDGIMILDNKVTVGTKASTLFNIEKDTVLEVGLTPNRADAASHIGVARDLQALLEKKVKWPSIKSFKLGKTPNPINVTVKNTKACPRYSALYIKGITVKDSPTWLKNKLQAIGVAPINNIVDITNFVLHELGQPLHAFDADQIKGNQVIVQTLSKNTTFITLDSKERKLQETDLMICNKDEAMCIAGVFGGIKSGISEKTTNVFLESAYFSPDFIRKTAQKHVLSTDASFRYERGTDPEITIYALKRAAMLIQEIAGGTIGDTIIDQYPKPFKPFEVKVSYVRVNKLIGKEIPPNKIKKILKNLDIAIKNDNNEGFIAYVPPYRVDVQREADIIEEILRIYGYDNITISQHLSSTFLAEYPLLNQDKIQLEVAKNLVSNGYYEIITNSLSKQSLEESFSWVDKDKTIHIANPLSEEMNILTQKKIFSSLTVIAYNINRKQKNLKFFEFGKTYHKEKNKFIEKKHLNIFITGDYESESWLRLKKGTTFHDLYGIITKILVKFNVSKQELLYIKNPEFSYCIEIQNEGKSIVKIGKVDKKLIKVTGVSQDVLYAIINWDYLVEKQNTEVKYEAIPKFPEVKRDLSLVLDKKITYSEVQKVIDKFQNKYIKNVNVFDVFKGENIGENKKAYALSFILQDDSKTLHDKTIDTIMKKLIEHFEKELNATIRN